jgi:hypothetical protein
VVGRRVVVGDGTPHTPSIHPPMGAGETPLPRSHTRPPQPAMVGAVMAAQSTKESTSLVVNAPRTPNSGLRSALNEWAAAPGELRELVRLADCFYR